MWPPSSGCSRFARTTIASAFHRTSAISRCSMSRLPGYCGCSASEIVLQYGVLNTGGSLTRRARASSRSLRRMNVARSAPSSRTSDSNASSHSRVSAGSRSAGITRQNAEALSDRSVMVGSSQRDSCRTSLLYLAAALLACDVALAQPQVSVVEHQHLTVQATGAHRLSLAVVQVDGTGWIRDKAEAVLREAATILAQCDIGITSVEWLRVSVPPRYLDFSTPTARELAVAAPVRRPA